MVVVDLLFLELGDAALEPADLGLLAGDAGLVPGQPAASRLLPIRAP